MKIIKYLLLFCLINFISCYSSIPMYFYSIPSFISHSKETPLILEDIAIEKFTSPPFLQQQEMILRQGNKNQLSFSPYHLWWGIPEDMVTQAFKNYLQSKNIFRHVFFYPTTHKVRYILEAMLHRFEFQTYPDKWIAFAALQIYVIDQTNNKILWDSGVVETSQITQPNFESAVQQMHIVLKKIFEQIAAKLKDLTLSAANAQYHNISAHNISARHCIMIPFVPDIAFVPGIVSGIV